MASHPPHPPSPLPRARQVICPIALVYFAISHFANKHAAVYELEDAWQAGGSLLPALVSRMCFAAGLYQLIMIGLLALKLAAGPAALVAPLPFVTIIFWSYTKRIAAHTAHLPADFAAMPSQVRQRRPLLPSTGSRPHPTPCSHRRSPTTRCTSRAGAS